MRDFASSPDNPNKALINVIYDNNRFKQKNLCCSVYDTSYSIPTLLQCPESFGYYKNVRKEYGTYVLNKEGHLLSVTRSMGDFNMYPYGIICEPTISSIDLSSILERYEESKEPKILCVLVSSDGVWDNWLFEDVQNFMLYDNCLTEVESNSDGAQKVLDSFMIRNKMFGTTNFGSSSDNATSTVIYIKK
jgi:hypothetical protein